MPMNHLDGHCGVNQAAGCTEVPAGLALGGEVALPYPETPRVPCFRLRAHFSPWRGRVGVAQVCWLACPGVLVGLPWDAHCGGQRILV